MKKSSPKFFTDIYGSWEELQREKFEKIFGRLGEKFTTQLKTKRILDIGAGAGYLEKFLAERRVPIKNIVALEPDRKMLRATNNFILAKAEDMPFKEQSFDIAFIFDAMHLIDKIDTSCLRDGAVIVVSLFCNDENLEEKRELAAGKIKGFNIENEFVIDTKEKELVIVAKRNRLTSSPAPRCREAQGRISARCLRRRQEPAAPSPSRSRSPSRCDSIH